MEEVIDTGRNGKLDRQQMERQRDDRQADRYIHTHTHTHTCIHYITYIHTHTHTHIYIHTESNSYVPSETPTLIYNHSFDQIHGCRCTVILNYFRGFRRSLWITYIHTYIHTYIVYTDGSLVLIWRATANLKDLWSILDRTVYLLQSIPTPEWIVGVWFFGVKDVQTDLETDWSLPPTPAPVLRSTFKRKSEAICSNGTEG
jgi:hypothetical protein